MRKVKTIEELEEDILALEDTIKWLKIHENIKNSIQNRIFR